MKIVSTLEELENLIEQNQMALVYFGSESCSVCTALKPKVEEILISYPRISSAEVDAEKAIYLSASYSIFTVPVVILFIEGREAIREARHISIQDIDTKISRYYNLFFC